MTEIPLRLKEGQPTPQTQKMAKTPLPSKKCLKYLQSKKNNLNTIEALKKTTIPLNHKKKNQNWKKYNLIFI